MTDVQSEVEAAETAVEATGSVAEASGVTSGHDADRERDERLGPPASLRRNRRPTRVVAARVSIWLRLGEIWRATRAVRLPGPQGDQGQVQELGPRVLVVDAQPGADPGCLLRPVHVLPAQRHPELRHLHVLGHADLELLPDRRAQRDQSRSCPTRPSSRRWPSPARSWRWPRSGRRSCSSCSSPSSCWRS